MRSACTFTVASLVALASPAQEFKSPRLKAVAAWIGNSYGGGEKWVQHDILALAVTQDGTVFSSIFWDEAGGNWGEYRDGELTERRWRCASSKPETWM